MTIVPKKERKRKASSKAICEMDGSGELSLGIIHHRSVIDQAIFGSFIIFGSQWCCGALY